MSRTWPTRSLRQCGRWISGGTPLRSNESYWGGDIPWISAKSIKHLRLANSPEQLTAAGAAEVGTVERGTVLFVVRGMSLAKEFRVGVAERTLSFNQDLRAIQPVADVDPFYLARFLAFAAPQVLRMVGDASHGTKRLPTNLLDELPVPIPPMAEQKRIAAVLDKADELRAKRRHALATLDTLLQSVFLDMFGDPVTNPKGWPRQKGESLFNKTRPGTRCGPFGSALKRDEYVPAGIPVWQIDNVSPNRFGEDGALYITERKYAELTGYSVEPGDILISRAGTVGRMCVAQPTASPSIIGTNLIRLSLDAEMVSPDFYTSLCTYFPRAMRLRAGSDDEGYSFMNTTTLASVKVIVPPIALQREFAFCLQRIREQERSSRLGIEALDVLFASLQSAAFAGTLFNGDAAKPAVMAGGGPAPTPPSCNSARRSPPEPSYLAPRHEQHLRPRLARMLCRHSWEEFRLKAELLRLDP